MKDDRKTTIRKIKKFKETKFNLHKDNALKQSYCLVFPCFSKKVIKRCYEDFKIAQRGNWNGDIITISSNDYKKLVKKSRDLEIIENL